jgi:hypothetical protein
VEHPSGGNSDDYLYYIANSGGSWSDPILLGKSNNHFGNHSICVDGLGVAHIVFISSDPWGHLFYWNSSVEFGEPVEIITNDNPSLTADDPDITSDHFNNLHISFSASQGSEVSDLYYVNNIGSSFSNPLVADPDVWISETNIDTDENGNVGISYSTYGSDGTNSIFYTSNAGGSFFPGVEVSVTADSIVQLLSEVIVSNGDAYVCYEQFNRDYICCSNPGRYDLYYTKLDEAIGGFVFPPVLFKSQAYFDEPAMAFEPPLDLEPAKIHLAYVDAYEVGRKKNKTWQPRLNYLVLDANNANPLTAPEIIDDNWSHWPKMTLDKDGDLHVAFTADYDLYYGTKTIASGENNGTECFVQNISMSTTYKGNGKPANRGWTATASVLIHDDLGNPISGATVSGQWSGLSSDFDAGITGSDGTVSLDSERINVTGTFTFTMDNVSSSTLIYNPALNVITSNSISNSGQNSVVSAEDRVTNNIHTEFQLFKNYHNPFNPTTTISYHLAESQSVRLTIYNLRGESIRRLVSGQQAAGNHSIDWDGRNETGQSVASGIYIYRIHAGQLVDTRRMVLLK